MARFNEYAAKVPDAPGGSSGGGFADISGSFLQAIAVSLFATAAPLEAVVTVTLDSKTPPTTGSVHLQWLKYPEHTLLDEQQVTYSGVAIDTDGKFTIQAGTLVIPQAAETVPLGQDASATDVVLTGVTVNADLFCGEVSGMAFGTTPLTGTTYGAARIPDGTMPSDVTPVTKCPSSADAGTSTADAP